MLQRNWIADGAPATATTWIAWTARNPLSEPPASNAASGRRSLVGMARILPSSRVRSAAARRLRARRQPGAGLATLVEPDFGRNTP